MFQEHAWTTMWEYYTDVVYKAATKYMTMKYDW